MHHPSSSKPKTYRSTIRASGNTWKFCAFLSPNSMPCPYGQLFEHCVGGGENRSSFYSKHLWRLLPIMLHDSLPVIYIIKRQNLRNYFWANLELYTTPVTPPIFALVLARLIHCWRFETETVSTIVPGNTYNVLSQEASIHKCVLNKLFITRWFKYDRDKLWLVYTQIVPVIFEPPCTNI